MLRFTNIKFKCPCGKEFGYKGKYGDHFYKCVSKCSCGIGTEFIVFKEEDSKVHIVMFSGLNLDDEKFRNLALSLKKINTIFVEVICEKCNEVFGFGYINNKESVHIFQCKCQKSQDIVLKTMNTNRLRFDIELSRNIAIKNRKEENTNERNTRN